MAIEAPRRLTRTPFELPGPAPSIAGIDAAAAVVSEPRFRTSAPLDLTFAFKQIWSVGAPAR